MLEHGPILELPLSLPFFREQADAFLRSCGLRLEEVDHYYVFQDRDGGILAGAGSKPISSSAWRYQSLSVLRVALLRLSQG